MTDTLAQHYDAGTFLHFYHGEWNRLLETIQIPNMADASWDRRAAYLLWLERNGDKAAQVAVEGLPEVDDLLG